jgi:uroporphyrinogen-III synthase
MAALDGLTVLVPESRELDLFAGMLEAEGARAWRCPLVRIRDLDDPKPALDFIARFIADPGDDMILFTGEGLRKLIALAGDRATAFLAALKRCRIIARGPKPVRALRETGLTAQLTPEPPTSDGIAAALSGETLAGRLISVQLYPGGERLALLTQLQQQGARLRTVTPYQYAGDAESDRVAAAITAMANGAVGMIAFTSSAQIDRLFAVAQAKGLGMSLRAGLEKIRIASVGPLVTAALKARGLAPFVQPESNFHLKPLVREILRAQDAAR